MYISDYLFRYCKPFPTTTTTTTTTFPTTTTTTTIITTTALNKCQSNQDCGLEFICGKGECFPGCNSNDNCLPNRECIKPVPNAIVGYAFNYGRCFPHWCSSCLLLSEMYFRYFSYCWLHQDIISSILGDIQKLCWQK